MDSANLLERWLLIALAVLGLGALTLFALLAYVVLKPWLVPASPPPPQPTLPGPFPSPSKTRFVDPDSTEVGPFWTAPARPTRTPFQPHVPTLTPRPSLTPWPTHTLVPTKTPRPTRRPTRAPTEKPAGPPEEASVSGVVGYAQISTLDCEARSAVDWAAFFGVDISEYDFLDALPSSDNPETGFVGNYWGAQGRLPPQSYGVHAPPVAALLRSYGLQAYDWKDLSWPDIQNEIAAGRPVIVWVVGNVFGNGSPEYYTAGDGQTVTVVRFEHTVIVTGYDSQTVTVVDGNMVYTRGIDTFLASWSVLGDMAITGKDISN